ncbi:MAG: cysteine peptidase family C39 domain-containing protein, partial [Myxococcota bacterium]
MLGWSRPHPQARRIVPEVIQTSNMDCGPASLKALMEGFGVPVSYGRLREACQTGVDGTSISTMDDVARVLGLDSDEILIPSDFLLVSASRALPAIAVVQDASGSTHFIVVWSVVGRWVQVMDPAQGRRWMSRQALLDQLYTHSAAVPAAAWYSWVSGTEFQSVLDARMADLGIAEDDRQQLRGDAAATKDWRGIGGLDAAVRMVTALIRTGAVRAGREARAMVAELAARERAGDSLIPQPYWSVRPSGEPDRFATDAAARDDGERDSDASAPDDPDPDPDNDELTVRGAVLVRVSGRSKTGRKVDALPEELRAALDEEPQRPGRTLLRLLGQDGPVGIAALVAAVFAAAGMALLEAALLYSGHSTAMARPSTATRAATAAARCTPSPSSPARSRNPR